MKFNAALKFLVAIEALSTMNIRSGVRAQSVVVDRTSDNHGDVIYSNVLDAATSDAKPVSLLPADSGGLSSPTDINGGDDGISSLNPFDMKYNPPQPHRQLKLSKKIGPSDPKIPVPPPFDVTGGGITGVYIYTNKCNNVFQVTIDCGNFGDNDPDLCSFSEFSQGTLLATREPGSELLPGGDLFFLPNAAIPVDGIINPDSVCEFSGTFRRSSSMVEEVVGGHTQFKLKPIPLASSKGCETTTINFQLVVKGTMKKAADDDGMILELQFSDDYGATYYTDDKDCLRSYIGQKVDEGEGERSRQRALALNGSDDKHTSNKSVVRRQLSFFKLVKLAKFWLIKSFCGLSGSSCSSPTPPPTPRPPTQPPTPRPPTRPPTTCKRNGDSCSYYDKCCEYAASCCKSRCEWIYNCPM